MQSSLQYSGLLSSQFQQPLAQKLLGMIDIESSIIMFIIYIDLIDVMAASSRIILNWRCCELVQRNEASWHESPSGQCPGASISIVR